MSELLSNHYQNSYHPSAGILIYQSPKLSSIHCLHFFTLILMYVYQLNSIWTLIYPLFKLLFTHCLNSLQPIVWLLSIKCRDLYMGWTHIYSSPILLSTHCLNSYLPIVRKSIVELLPIVGTLIYQAPELLSTHCLNALSELLTKLLFAKCRNLYLHIVRTFNIHYKNLIYQVQEINWQHFYLHFS